MPNWCNNHITITGKEEDLKCIFEAKLSFNKLCPRPAEQNENWYQWNCEHWGTKWDINEDEIDITLDVVENGIYQINAEFLTAWSPPDEFFRYLTKQMPGLKVKAEYFEYGMDFCGDVIFENGKIFSREMDEDEKISFIKEHFDSTYGEEYSDDEESGDEEEDDTDYKKDQ